MQVKHHSLHEECLPVWLMLKNNGFATSIILGIQCKHLNSWPNLLPHYTLDVEAIYNLLMDQKFITDAKCSAKDHEWALEIISLTPATIFCNFCQPCQISIELQNVKQEEYQKQRI